MAVCLQKKLLLQPSTAEIGVVVDCCRNVFVVTVAVIVAAVVVDCCCRCSLFNRLGHRLQEQSLPTVVVDAAVVVDATQ